MAEETLRRNLERAFDPGPDFPDALLMSRTMAILQAEAKPVAHGRGWRLHDPWLSAILPRKGMRLLAGVLMVLVAATAVGIFLGINQFAHRSIPAHSPRAAVSRTCAMSGLLMVTDKVGWQAAGFIFPSTTTGPYRSTDGGVSWRDTSPPRVPGWVSSDSNTCILDADHAWVPEVAGSSETTTGQVEVFVTQDGGLTWQVSNPVPISGAQPDVQLQFIDDRHGWLLTDTGLYSPQGATTTIYTTVDGGLNWSQVATSGTVSSSTGRSISWLWEDASCLPRGMTFVSLSKGWLTWDCITRSFFTRMRTVVLSTNDGGRTWAPVSLPSQVAGTDSNCAATPPVFTGNQGLLQFACLSQPGSYVVSVYSTADAGRTWTDGPLNFDGQVDFVDGSTAFFFDRLVDPASNAGTDLYRTNDGGRSWTVVQGLFPGQVIGPYQFIDANTGFAYTHNAEPRCVRPVLAGCAITPLSPPAPWKTTDGGKTWAASAP